MNIRHAAVAGQFYSDDPDELAHNVDSYIHSGLADVNANSLHGLIVPHAGYIYSGPVAGVAYWVLQKARSRIRTVVLAGPSHRVFLEGIGASLAAEWHTPLGPVAIAQDETSKLLHEFSAVNVRDDAHAPEHSLEVQLPFLQRVLDPDWQLLPLVVGHVDSNVMAEVLEPYLTRPDVVVIVSTDLSHYLTYDDARERDNRTAWNIIERNPDHIFDDDACGAYPLRGALVAAKEGDCNIELLALANSGDTQGSRDRVVGYGAFAITGG
jgi:AmmeMemoRadiSam system protein B